jgi:branched-chain amino acid transport system substrate-binding protein
LYLFAAALKEANDLDPDLLRAMVLGTSFNAPQGKITVDPCSGHTDVWTRIGRANRHGGFDILDQSDTAVQADPFLIGYGRTMAGAEG